MAGLVIVVVLVGMALLAPWITATDGIEPQLADRLRQRELFTTHAGHEPSAADFAARLQPAKHTK